MFFRQFPPSFLWFLLSFVLAFPYRWSENVRLCARYFGKSETPRPWNCTAGYTSSQLHDRRRVKGSKPFCWILSLDTAWGTLGAHQFNVKSSQVLQMLKNQSSAIFLWKFWNIFLYKRYPDTVSAGYPVFYPVFYRISRRIIRYRIIRYPAGYRKHVYRIIRYPVSGKITIRDTSSAMKCRARRQKGWRKEERWMLNW